MKQEPTAESEVYLVALDLEIYVLDGDYQKLMGAFLDTGATISLIGSEKDKL